MHLGGSGYLGLVAGNITGIRGGKYYWYYRAEVLPVLAAVVISGISGLLLFLLVINKDL